MRLRVALFQQPGLDDTVLRIDAFPRFIQVLYLFNQDPLCKKRRGIHFEIYHNSASKMSLPIALLVVASVIGLLLHLGSRTDIPKIKNLPELPGVPVFGSLFLLGKHHARNCARLAKQYGDVFQVRLGNRVGRFLKVDLSLKH